MILNREIIELLNDKLNLPATGNEQDWSIEMASRFRLKDFIEFQRKEKLSFPLEYGVTSLIIASYDEFIFYETDEDLRIWNEIVKILNYNKGKYDDLLNYWAQWGEIDEEDIFNVSHLIRDYINTSIV